MMNCFVKILVVPYDLSHVNDAKALKNILYLLLSSVLINLIQFTNFKPKFAMKSSLELIKFDVSKGRYILEK